MFSRLQSVPSGPQYKEKDPSPAKKNIKKVILTLSTNCVIMACDQCQQNEKDSLVAVTSHFPNMANQPTEKLIYRKNFPRSQNINRSSIMSLEITMIDHFTCTSLVFYQLRHCVSSSTFCLLVKLGKVVERNSSQRVEKVKPGNFGLVSILSHTLYISLEPRLIDFQL